MELATMLRVFKFFITPTVKTVKDRPLTVPVNQTLKLKQQALLLKFDYKCMHDTKSDVNSAIYAYLLSCW